jgi:DNA-binding FadR family transcriptional regulator
MTLKNLVRQTPLVVQVAEQFRELIASGDWPVGSRIPGEHQLAEQLGVSRGTVREALRALSVAGLLEPRVGDGTYVRATDEITGALVRGELPYTLAAVLDARAGLEAAAARLAARSAPPEAIAALDRALTARAATLEEGGHAGFVAADAAFHRAVVQASGNPLLLRLHEAIAAVLAQSIGDTTELPEDPRVTATHRELLEAIRSGDAERAAAAPYALIESVKDAAARLGDEGSAAGA